MRSLTSAYHFQSLLDVVHTNIIVFAHRDYKVVLLSGLVCWASARTLSILAHSRAHERYERKDLYPAHLVCIYLYMGPYIHIVMYIYIYISFRPTALEIKLMIIPWLCHYARPVLEIIPAALLFPRACMVRFDRLCTPSALQIFPSTFQLFTFRLWVSVSSCEFLWVSVSLRFSESFWVSDPKSKRSSSGSFSNE